MEDLTEEDMYQILIAAVEQDGLVGHNIKAFNDLLQDGIPKFSLSFFKSKKLSKIREVLQTWIKRENRLRSK